ncbi:MAG: response regulator [Acidobacteria bacterium]|nr:MAG: response regulator [Acidobacteriota bacterium]
MSAPTLLVVEDSPTMRQLIAFTLRRLQGCRILEAVDGVDALKKLTTDRVDLVITDINMPMMDGLKLVSLIRGNARTKAMPIVIVTTEGADEDRKRGLALGANAYIPKPIQPSALLKTVTSLLEPARG